LTRQVVPCIIQEGHEVVIAAFMGSCAGSMTYHVDGWPIQIYGWSDTPDAFAQRALLPLWDSIKPDIGILCADCWRVPPEIAQQIRLALWSPIHHQPESDLTLDCMRASVQPMVYSLWGREILAQQDVTVDYLPACVDASVFQPANRTEARAWFGLDTDTFLVTMVGINHVTDAKGYTEALQAFARFAEIEPDSRLYLQTNMGGGVNLGGLAARLGIEHLLITPDQVHRALGLYDDAYLARLYNASDVLLNTSRWEGFGLPLVEAQMCGTPVIAPDYGTQRELLLSGWPVTYQRTWCNHAETWGIVCHIESIVDALQKAHLRRGSETGQHVKIAGHYGTSAVFENYWRPALTKMEGLL